MIYILCRQNEDDSLTGIGVELSEASAKDLADDGDFVVVPVQIGKLYVNIINSGIVGAVTFNNTSLKTLLNTARTAILGLRDDIQTLQSQMSAGTTAIQNINSSIQALDDRITALENA